MPTLSVLFSQLNLVSTTWLRAKRKYIYVCVFILAAIVTPGVDVLTQIIVALPMIALYELGILLLWLFRF